MARFAERIDFQVRRARIASAGFGDIVLQQFDMESAEACVRSERHKGGPGCPQRCSSRCHGRIEVFASNGCESHRIGRKLDIAVSNLYKEGG